METAVHVIDFEGNRQSGILEYGVVTLLRGEIVSTATRLCASEGRISAMDAEVHGIRERDVRNCDAFSEEWDLFAKLRETGVLAGHFAATENGLLKSIWPYPRASPDFLFPGREIAEWGPWIDTGYIFKEMGLAQESARLEDLVVKMDLMEELEFLAQKYCPEARAGFHSALYDAMATALLLLSIEQNQEGPTVSLGWMLEMSTADPGKKEERRQGRLF